MIDQPPIRLGQHRWILRSLILILGLVALAGTLYNRVVRNTELLLRYVSEEDQCMHALEASEHLMLDLRLMEADSRGYEISHLSIFRNHFNAVASVLNADQSLWLHATKDIPQGTWLRASMLSSLPERQRQLDQWFTQDKSADRMALIQLGVGTGNRIEVLNRQLSQALRLRHNQLNLEIQKQLHTAIFSFIAFSGLFFLMLFSLLITILTNLRRELKQSAEWHQQSLIDDLTGLSNRRQFQQQIHQSLQRAERLHQRLALFYIDLDGFKFINDTYGHDTGDKVLVFVAQTIRQQVRPYDLNARIGGDEFAILIPDPPDDPNLERMALRIIEQLEQGPYPSLSASIGIACYPIHAANAWDLQQVADRAMYLAKEHGKHRYYWA